MPPGDTVPGVKRRLALALSVCLLAGLAACGSEKEPVAAASLFSRAELAAKEKKCGLEPAGSLVQVLPVLGEHLDGVAVTVKAEKFPAAGADARSVTCVWDSTAGFITLTAVKGSSAPAVMLAHPSVTLRYGDAVAFVPMGFAEALALRTAPDEVLVLTAPGLVSRDMLINAVRVIAAPAMVEWPPMRLPEGARPNVDVFRTGVAIAVCGKKITIRPTATKEKGEAGFVSNVPGLVDIYPRSDADAYALATMKRVLRAAPVTWEEDGLHVAAAVFAPSCDGKPASAWGWVFDDPRAKAPSLGPVPLEELYARPVTGNAWRILVEVASEKPSSPAFVPEAPEVDYNVKRTPAPTATTTP